MKTLWIALSSLSLMAFAAGCAGHDDPEPGQSAEEVTGAQGEALTCKDVGQACAYAGQCCSSNCTKGVCGKIAVCRVNSAYCNVNSDCCSNHCVANVYGGGVSYCQP